MTCDDIRTILNDYIDGGLDPGQQSLAERHLAACDGCRSELRALRDLIDAAARLPRTAQPGRDLWPGIAAAATEVSPVTAGTPPPRRAVPAWLTLPRLAAAAVVLVGLTVVITLEVMKPVEEGPVAAWRVPPEPRNATVAMQADFRAAETEFQQATGMLAAVLERRRGEMTPETIALVEENLKIINQAIEAVQAAIESDPGNRDLGLLLTAMYRTKVDLMQRATRMPAAL